MGGDEKKEEAVQAAAEQPPTLQPPPGMPGALGALEALFKEHYGAVYRAAYRITGDPMDAEDILQTVFTRILRREVDLDLSQGAGSYLHRAAVNAALDLLRQRKRRPSMTLEEAEPQLVDEASANPEQNREGRELRGRLRAALSRLSPKSAEIFALRYFEGVGNLEIARKMGASQTSIAVILHRARHRLQQELLPREGGLS
ncbi:MAG: polymerase sigma-70 factor, subfamily [Acidobacteriota bacterium]|jgi:RNA polymerase sigma-70 factor (ECF subfamily)|nr:polymerase sigma-70 factor, subfamily [Acidobacteriota bacterium]